MITADFIIISYLTGVLSVLIIILIVNYSNFLIPPKKRLKSIKKDFEYIHKLNMDGKFNNRIENNFDGYNIANIKNYTLSMKKERDIWKYRIDFNYHKVSFMVDKNNNVIVNDFSYYREIRELVKIINILVET